MSISMKPLFRIIIIMMFAVNANGQWAYLTLPKLTPDSLFGTYDVFFSSTGAVGTFGTCASFIYPGTEFWVGVGSGGDYTFTISKPVYRIQINFVSLDDGEFITTKVNGVPYAIQPSDMISYTECTGGSPVILSGGIINGPTSNFGGGDFIITNCKGINSFELYSNGFDAGTMFHIAIDTVIPTYCLQAISEGVICAGDDLHLDALGDSAGATYYWHGPAGFTSTKKHAVVTGTTTAYSGVYHLVKIIGGLSVDSTTTSVTVKPTPVLTVTSNSPICYGVGNTLNLFASPYTTGETFSWTGPNLFSSTLQNPTVTGFGDADTGFYTIVATLNGCSSSFTTHVVYAPIPPPPGITGITTYCTGETFVPFTVTGTGSILWYPAPTGGTGSPTAPTVNTSVAGTYTYWASQTVLGCESPRGSITVVVNTTPPAPAITGTNVYCQYDTYIPPSATGTAILWYTALTGGIGTASPPTVNTSIPGVYTIYATQNVSGCESPRAPFVITIHAKPPNPLISADPSLYCQGQPFVPFTVFSGTGILWYTTLTGGTGTTTAPTVDTKVTGVYTFYASQTVLGCESDRATIVVTVSNGLKADFEPIIHWGCKADTVFFRNTSVRTTDYIWRFGDGFSSTLDSPTHIYLVQALDTVKLYASISVCSDSTTKYLDLRHPLHASFVVDTDLICQGSSVKFTDAGSVGKVIKYLWEYGDHTLHAPATGTGTTHYYTSQGVFNSFLAVSDSFNCTDTMFKPITVDTTSPLSLKVTDTVICMGTTITFTGDYAKIGNTGITWDIGNGDIVKDINPLVYGFHSAGQYTIKASAFYRVCPNPVASSNVTVIAQPSIDLGTDQSICKGSESITLADNINAGNPLASWEWSSGEKTAAISVSQPGVYTATVKLHGCTASGTVKVSNDCYMNIPNIFTPNNDGVNDYFYPHQYLTSGLTSFRISIFNRWGEMVFQSNSLDGRGWDGKLNDVPQPEGVYVYLVEGTFKDGQKERHQGNVTLLR
jgi:gliding motility-associated-like protein